jgi:pimeloyl-ACP methyl ester carboxylesterase
MAILTTAGGARIGWDEFGDPADPAMVLIQGHGAQMVGWRPGFCERVAQEGFRVIRFDNRDVGESQRYPEGGYTVGDFADDTAAFLDALGLPDAHIVGQSMGGIIALEFAKRHPERARSFGLLYTAPGLEYAAGRDLIEDRLAMEPPTTREEFQVYYPITERPCASPAYRQDVEWLTELAGVIWDRGWEPEGAERQFAAVLGWEGATEAARIAVPTTIMAGDGDRLIDSRASIALHQAIDDSTVRIFPGMGHELPEPLWATIAEQLGDNARLGEARRAA